MGEEWFKSCLPMSYYDQFIAEGIYPDGRSISAFTPLSFKLGAWGGVGSSLIRQGGVAVSCNAQASLALCHDGPLITYEVEACSSISQEEVNDVISLLKKVFSSEVIPPSALLVKGTEDTTQMTWELALKIQVLNSGGPIPDVTVCAVSAALLNTCLPAVKITHAKDDESPIQVEEILVLDEVTSLDLKKFPVAVTFYIFKSGKREMLLVDPPQEVIEYCAARVSVITDGEFVLAMNTRGLVTDDHLLLSIATLAEQRHKSIMEVIRGDVFPD